MVSSLCLFTATWKQVLTLYKPKPKPFDSTRILALILPERLPLPTEFSSFVSIFAGWHYTVPVSHDTDSKVISIFKTHLPDLSRVSLIFLTYDAKSLPNTSRVSPSGVWPNKS